MHGARSSSEDSLRTCKLLPLFDDVAVADEEGSVGVVVVACSPPHAVATVLPISADVLKGVPKPIADNKHRRTPGASW